MTSQWCKTANLPWDQTERDWADPFPPFAVPLLLFQKNNNDNSCSNSGGFKVTGKSSIKVCQVKEIVPVGFPSSPSAPPGKTCVS